MENEMLTERRYRSYRLKKMTISFQWMQSRLILFRRNLRCNRREYTNINELICLSNMENIIAVLIEDGLSQKERLIKLNKIHSSRLSSASIHVCKLPPNANRAYASGSSIAKVSFR